MDKTIAIGERFCGPPTSGNGGYVCGMLAGFVDSPGVSVRLKIPPPLDRELTVRESDDGMVLLDAETVVAIARPANVSVDVPTPPSLQEAEEASKTYVGFTSHPYRTCFVCGPNREIGDGLRIFPGEVAGRGLVASPWVPDDSLAKASDEGVVANEFLWAALDCPGGLSFPWMKRAKVLLGELKVELVGEVPVGERCVVVGWEISHEGRKHITGTALFGESGEVRGVGLGTWIEVQL